MKKIKTLLLAAIALVLGVSVSGAVKNTVRADEVVTLASATSSFSMVNGAAVYVSENAEPRTGLKFKATLSNSDYASLNTLSGVTYGFIIMPADYVTEGYEITAANLFGDSAVYCFEAPAHDAACTKKHLAYTENPVITEDESIVSISASLVGIQQNNIPRTYIGVAYIKSGEEVVLASYVDNKVEDNARSMLYVAQKAVENNDENSSTLITNYFAPFAGKNIPYTVKYEVYGDNLGTETLIKSETLTQTATFNGTGLTKITAPDYSGADSAFDGAVKDSDSTEYVVYNENKTQITVKYTRSFNTTLTSTDRQDLIVGPENSVKNAISLAGVSEYSSVDSVEYKGVNLGAAIDNLDLADIDGVAHGEGDVKVTVTDEFDLKHEITVPVTVITEVITDRNELLHKVQYHKDENNNDPAANLGEGKYYVLGSDIEVGDTSKHTYGGTNYAATNNSNYGFVGTLDGRGYTLTGVETSGWNGLFGGIQGGTIKNLGVSIDSYQSSSLFGYYIKNAIVNNVVVVINEVIDNTASVDVGFIAHNQAETCTFTNFVVHAEGSSLKYLTSKGALGNSSTYTDCAIYAKRYTAGTSWHTSAPAGLTFTSTEAIKGQAVGTASGATSYDFALPQSFNGSTVTDITVNNVSLGASATDVSMSDIATAVGSTYGQYPAVITLKNNGVSFKLKTTFAYATKVITDWATLLHTVQYHSGNAGANVGVGEYYVLGNDITGSGVYGHSWEGTYYPVTTDVGNETEGWKATDNFFGFAGTLDGNGYTLKNVTINSVGIFGSLYNATIKNLDIEISEWSSGGSAIFAYWMYGTTVENVNVTIKNATKDLTNSGILADNQARNCTFKNFVLNAKGIALGKIASTGYYGGATTTYENSEIYAADYTSFGAARIEPISGLKFYKDRQTITLTGDTVSVELPTAIKNSTYSCYRVRINGKDNMLIDGTVIENNTCKIGGTSYNAIDMTKLSVAKIKELIGTNYGDYEIEFAIASNGLGYGYTGIYLPVTFVAPTAE